MIMKGRFIRREDVAIENLDWSTLGWVLSPSSTAAKMITFIELTIKPGMGHNFHLHPKQEEVIMVVEGQVEQWLEQEKTILTPGEAVFISPGVVHASFNPGSKPAKAIVVLSPSAGESGVDSIEVGEQEPWVSLR
jgi:quercetin dioxygenase-like cupin family protein